MDLHLKVPILDQDPASQAQVQETRVHHSQAVTLIQVPRGRPTLRAHTVLLHKVLVRVVQVQLDPRTQVHLRQRRAAVLILVHHSQHQVATPTQAHHSQHQVATPTQAHHLICQLILESKRIKMV